MANAALVIHNLALEGMVSASSQELAMPAANLLSPHTTERWRSASSSAFFVVDLGAPTAVDTFAVKGLTCSESASIQLRCSLIDSSGADGEALDTGEQGTGGALDVDYGAAAWALESAVVCRYVRIDLDDEAVGYVEAGVIVIGLREVFETNFAPGASVQYVDRSRVATTAAGLSQVEDDAWFRRVDLSFEFISITQRYGLIEQLDRIAGRRRNVLLLLDEQSDNLARDTFFGLVTDLTPNTYAQAVEIYGKQLRIDERL